MVRTHAVTTMARVQSPYIHNTNYRYANDTINFTNVRT